MKKLLVAVLIAGSLVSMEARAQSRAGGAALGAVSGAVVLGPVGAVAGAVIGYTAGPAIAHSWGIGRSTPRSRGRRVTSSEPGTHPQASAKESAPPAVKPPDAPVMKQVGSPVQGFD